MALIKSRKGRWNFFLERLNIKLPYTYNSLIDCRAKSTPKRSPLFSGKLDSVDFKKYQVSDWKHALSKSCKRRAVENYIATQRLAEAGLGPKALGFCYIKNFHSHLFKKPCENFGIIVENVYKLPSKKPPTEVEILNAGVHLEQNQKLLPATGKWLCRGLKLRLRSNAYGRGTGN
ncbi:hypothetical protein ACFPK9_06020 [Rubritalea spongiae]|uniref:Uncharacterized protein n=1 Tax=Rubritalea spongiae TaxID=430797 RepID=A0ABW5E4K6_9BACT